MGGAAGRRVVKRLDCAVRVAAELDGGLADGVHLATQPPFPGATELGQLRAPRGFR